MSTFVGYDWDAYLISSRLGRELTGGAQPILEKVWAARNRSPFQKRRKKDDAPGPARDWQRQLQTIIADSLGDDFIEGGREAVMTSVGGSEPLLPQCLREGGRFSEKPAETPPPTP